MLVRPPRASFGIGIRNRSTDTVFFLFGDWEEIWERGGFEGTRHRTASSLFFDWDQGQTNKYQSTYLCTFISLTIW